MRILYFDYETTGANVEIDRPVETGFCLWDCETNQPLLVESLFLYADDYPPMQPEALKIHGISKEILDEFSQSPKQVYLRLEEVVSKYKPSFMVGHNCTGFDLPIFMNDLKRLGLELPNVQALKWIDTQLHLPEYGRSKALNYIAADLGFINPFKHRAALDCLTGCLVLSHYDINEVVKISQTPKVRLRGRLQPGEPEFEKKKSWLKERRYSWNGELKYWEKDFMETGVDQEKDEAQKQGIRLIISI